MKNQELFNRTVSILVKAYQNETLEHQKCCACAVGNLVLASQGLTPIKNGEELEWDYNIPYSYGGDSWYGAVVENNINPKIEEFISHTGYSIQQLKMIENAFEKGHYPENDKDGFDGLMSVVDALMKIHEASPIEAENAKQLFTKEISV